MLLLSPRQLEILRLAREQGRVTVEGLSGHFQVTPQTIRKDLNELCDARYLQRVHGGAVVARSEGLGRGLELELRFPATDEAEAAAEKAAAPEPARRRILVVDDNRDAADMLSLLLQRHGNEAETVYDGDAAIAALRSGTFDAALVDLGMPGVDGFDVARAVRSEAALGGVRLIALTGWGRDEDRERSSAAGFDGHLVKPPKVRELFDLLDAL